MSAARYRCVIRLGPDSCGHPPAYVIYFADCPHVACDGRLFCIGHAACVEHAAQTRAGDYHSAGVPEHWTREQDLDVEQITDLALAW